ncbi:hypothetical protein SAMN06272781_5831 [Streptomyces sp. 1222.2]|uniref:hypothetical protein n=1 Tax=Streptomyces sp. 1222.2 TaxID=1938833 RepID=UPI000BD4D6CD|nr:hypothetical protein [Streptomyces sp. 1222.2]SOD77933.1 hypothetical protein SAMN06272781_5831 [Streptomyces sp. 1222.2]
MVEEEDAPGGGEGAKRHRSWRAVVPSETAAHTVLPEPGGAAVAGLVALVGWPFGWQPEPGLPALGLSIPASQPAAQLYRDARPPRRRAALAAFLTPATVSLLLATALNRTLPATADPGIGLLVGYALALPVGAAVLVRSLDPPDTV